VKTPKPTVGIWKVLQSTDLFRGRTQAFRSEQVELPNGKVMPSYYVMDFPDWVHAIPLTSAGEVILVEQYRHATGEITLEFPGGTTHSATEDPSLAALRELEEETGFTSAHLVSAGHLSPNPAFQSNRIHTYVAFDCQEVGPQVLDPYEVIDVHRFPLGELAKLIEGGRFSHALMVAGFHRAIPIIRTRFSDI
jgi:8-oxo-dGTP pyrophosphatase MutT (NUDIX family)